MRHGMAHARLRPRRRNRARRESGARLQVALLHGGVPHHQRKGTTHPPTLRTTQGMHPHRHRTAPSRRRQSHLYLRRPAAHLCRPAVQGHGEALRTRPRRESLLLLGLQAPHLHPRRGELVLSTRGAEGTGERGGSRQSRQEKCREEPRQEQRHQGRHPHLRSHHTAGGGTCQELAGAVSARQPPRILHAVCRILPQLRCRQGAAAQLDAAAVWQPVRRHQEHRRLDVQAPRQLRLLAPLCPRRTIQAHPPTSRT